VLARGPESAERDAAEARLGMNLAEALVAVSGWSDPEVEALCDRAYEIARRLDDPALLSPAIMSLATMHEVRGNYERAQELMELRLQVQERTAGENTIESYELLACSQFHQGMFSEALVHAEKGSALYRPRMHSTTPALAEHPGVACHDWAALSLWFLGSPQAALERAQQAVLVAEEPGNIYGLTLARAQAAILHQCRDEPEQTRDWAEATLVLARRQGFPYRIATGQVLHGWAVARLGDTETGIAELREGLQTALDTGAEMDHPYFLALLADASLQAGQPEEALAVTDEALGRMGQRRFFYEAELLRLKASSLQQLGRTTEAADCLDRALAVARSQSSPPLVLRAATDIARARNAAGDREGAQALLLEAIALFPAGDATPDLAEASALLSEMRTGGGPGAPRPARSRAKGKA
jgi:tetratricopeptide (TPR) repeat protein